MEWVDMVHLKWKTLIQWGIIFLTLGFLFYLLYQNWTELRSYPFDISWGLFLFSYVFLFVHFVLIALAWGILLRRLQPPGVPLLQAIRIRTISDFGRFLPGKIWFVLWRIAMCKKYRIAPEIIGLSAFLEEYLNILSTILVFVVTFILVTHTPLTQYALYTLALLPIAFLLLHPRLFSVFPRLLRKIFKHPEVKLSARYSAIISLLSLFFIAWIILGIGFYMMATAISPVDIDLLLPLTGVFAISWALGFIVIILPGGLGLRETVLTYLLAFFVPLPIAIILSLISRIWLISGEALTALVFQFTK